jgi:hypothetical protein
MSGEYRIMWGYLFASDRLPGKEYKTRVDGKSRMHANEITINLDEILFELDSVSK